MCWMQNDPSANVGEEELVQNERTVSLNLVILYKALGGGWKQNVVK